MRIEKNDLNKDLKTYWLRSKRYSIEIYPATYRILLGFEI